jgi:hypothetical protein
MFHRTAAWFTLGALLVACGGEVDSDAAAPPEAFASVQQAVETNYDAPATASLEVLSPETWAVAWVFACDSNHRLQLRRNIATNGWGSWEVLDTSCEGVPSVAKWRVGPAGAGGYDSVAVYGRYSDGHLWELWWPDATNLPGTRQWADISAVTGFGNIAGSPVVAETNSADGFVSVAVRKASNNELFTMDFVAGAWSFRKVISAGTTAIRTSNTVTARGQTFVSGNFLSYLAGRGLTSSDDTTGWIARRQATDYTGSYTRVASLDNSASGTAFPAVKPEYLFFRSDRIVARFGSALKRKELDAIPSWTTYDDCVVNGSPRGATKPGDADDYDQGFVRGGETVNVTNDLMFWSVDWCSSVGGNMYSAAAAFEHANSLWLKKSATYKGSNDRVYFYNGDTGTHTSLGLTLP